MKGFGILRAALALASSGFGLNSAFHPYGVGNGIGKSYRKCGPGRKHYKGSGKEGLPSGYPGAKLARKFINKTATIRHGKYTTGAI